METTFKQEFGDITDEAQERSRDFDRNFIDASKTWFWKEYLIPVLDGRIAMFDEMHISVKDPYERYGLTEAYKALRDFKIMLLDELEMARKNTA